MCRGSRSPPNEGIFMTVEIYDSKETVTANTALNTLLTSLPEPFILLGGWAVYLTTSLSFGEIHGAPYLGSRDLDVGFHIDLNMSVDELRQSTFSKAIDVAKNAGYFPHGSFRYCKIIRKETGEILTETESKKIPMYELFYLYLDMMVDNIHPNHSDVFNMSVLDEPILARIFDEKLGLISQINETDVLLPPPYLLLATKLRAIQNRTRDDKTIKDACDIYALIWHSSVDYNQIIKVVKEEYCKDCEKALQVISENVARTAAYHLGIEYEQYRDVIGKLKI